VNPENSPEKTENPLHLWERIGILRTKTPDFLKSSGPPSMSHRAASQHTNSFPPQCASRACCESWQPGPFLAEKGEIAGMAAACHEGHRETMKMVLP